MKTTTLRESLSREFNGQICWSQDELYTAIDAALASSHIDCGWCWSVGTRGSIHFVSGTEATEEQAATVLADVFRRSLNSNPACGTFDSDLRRERSSERFRRLLGEVSRQLNSN